MSTSDDKLLIHGNRLLNLGYCQSISFPKKLKKLGIKIGNVSISNPIY